MEVFIGTLMELCLSADKHGWFERLMQDGSDLPLRDRIPYEATLNPDVHIKDVSSASMAVRMCIQTRNKRLRQLSEQVG